MLWRGHANLLFSNWLNYFVSPTDALRPDEVGLGSYAAFQFSPSLLLGIGGKQKASHPVINLDVSADVFHNNIHGGFLLLFHQG